LELILAEGSPQFDAAGVMTTANAELKSALISNEYFWSISARREFAFNTLMDGLRISF
jgi:hypothetical protein